MEASCGRRGRPSAEHEAACADEFGRTVSCEEFAPVVGGLQGLMVGVVVGCLSSPVDRQVDLADLLERLGRVLQPRRHLAVAGMGADDRVDVAVEDGEASVVPLQHPPLVPIGQRPAIRPHRHRCQRGADGVQASPVRLHAGVAKSGGVGDRIELEVVDVTVELELDHPVHQLARRDLGGRRGPRVQVEQPTTRVADDPARVVSTSDHLDRARQRGVDHRVELGRIGARPRRLEHVDRPVHLAAVRVRRPPPAEIGPRPDQRKDGVGQRGHSDQQRILRAERTPEGRRRIQSRAAASIGSRRRRNALGRQAEVSGFPLGRASDWLNVLRLAMSTGA